MHRRGAGRAAERTSHSPESLPGLPATPPFPRTSAAGAQRLKTRAWAKQRTQGPLAAISVGAGAHGQGTASTGSLSGLKAPWGRGPWSLAMFSVFKGEYENDLGSEGRE